MPGHGHADDLRGDQPGAQLRVVGTEPISQWPKDLLGDEGTQQFGGLLLRRRGADDAGDDAQGLGVAQDPGEELRQP